MADEPTKCCIESGERPKRGVCAAPVTDESGGKFGESMLEKLADGGGSAPFWTLPKPKAPRMAESGALVSEETDSCPPPAISPPASGATSTESPPRPSGILRPDGLAGRWRLDAEDSAVSLRLLGTSSAVQQSGAWASVAG